MSESEQKINPEEIDSEKILGSEAYAFLLLAFSSLASKKKKENLAEHLATYLRGLDSSDETARQKFLRAVRGAREYPDFPDIVQGMAVGARSLMMDVFNGIIEKSGDAEDSYEQFYRGADDALECIGRLMLAAERIPPVLISGSEEDLLESVRRDTQWQKLRALGFSFVQSLHRTDQNRFVNAWVKKYAGRPDSEKDPKRDFSPEEVENSLRDCIWSGKDIWRGYPPSEGASYLIAEQEEIVDQGLLDEAVADSRQLLRDLLDGKVQGQFFDPLTVRKEEIIEKFRKSARHTIGGMRDGSILPSEERGGLPLWYDGNREGLFEAAGFPDWLPTAVYTSIARDCIEYTHNPEALDAARKFFDLGPETPHETWREYARSENWELRLLVATHNATPLDVLQEMIDNPLRDYSGARESAWRNMQRRQDARIHPRHEATAPMI